MSAGLTRLARAGAADPHRTLADRAFAALHDAIVAGHLAPGERLPIEELGVALGMSAMPIREALRRLDGAGLVENIPHRGGRVTQLSILDLAEVYEARLALEPLAVRRAAERFGDGEAAEATFRLDALNELPDDNAPETWAAHTAFHFALYDAAGSSWLRRLIQPLWETSQRYRLAVSLSPKLASRRAEHGIILQACIDHDADRAARSLHDHLTMTANHVSMAMGGGVLFEPAGGAERAFAEHAPR
jgi:DNA-binding GntR family transcriptional regulator